jgi:hypothetical protein
MPSRLKQHLTSASASFKHTAQWTVILSNVLCVGFGAALLVFIKMGGKSRHLILDNDFWNITLFFAIGLVLVAFFALYASITQVCSVKGHWRAHNNRIIVWCLAGLFLLFIIGLTGMIFLAGIDKVVVSVEDINFNESQYTWSQNKVMTYLRQRIKTASRETYCDGVFGNGTGGSVMVSGFVCEHSSFCGDECKDSRQWFPRWVKESCTHSYEPGSPLAKSMAACKEVHAEDASCIYPRNQQVNTSTVLLGDASCIYCECRPALLELLHKTSIPLFASGLGFMVFEIGLGLLSVSLVFSKRKVEVESWQHFWREKEFKRQTINSIFDGVCLFAGGVLGYLDIITDCYVAYSFFQSGDVAYGALTCTFLLMPPLILSFVSIFFIGARGSIQSDYWGAARAVTFTELGYQTLRSLATGARTPEYQHSRIIETAFESVPQSVLQFYIMVIRWGTATTEVARQSQRLLFGSALISMGSIAICCVTFISHGYLSDIDINHFMFKATKLHRRVGPLAVGLYSFSDIAAHILIWATFIAVNLQCGPSRWWLLCLAFPFVIAERALLIRYYDMVPHRPRLAISALLVMLDYPTSSMHRLENEDAAIEATEAGKDVYSIAYDAHERQVAEVPMSEQTHFISKISDTALLHRQLALSLLDNIWMGLIIYFGRETLSKELQSAHLLLFFGALWFLKLMAYRVLYVLGDEHFGWKPDAHIDQSKSAKGFRARMPGGGAGGNMGSAFDRAPRKKDSMEVKDNPLFTASGKLLTVRRSSRTGVIAMKSMGGASGGGSGSSYGTTVLTRHVTKHTDVI